MSLALHQLYSQSEPPLIRVSRGPVFSDITTYFRHFTHTLRLYQLEGNACVCVCVFNCQCVIRLYIRVPVFALGHAGKSLEISNTVDIRSEVNRELVMRLRSDVANGNRFFTDLNGFQVCDVTVMSL